MGDTDDIFLKRFSLVIVALVGITFVILFIAGLVAPEPDPTANPSRVALAYDRTTPVGRVRTDVSELQAGVASPAPATPAADSTGADGSTAMAAADPVDTSGIDGGAIYAQACQVCHMAGAAGAPIPGSDQWAERAQKGLEQLAYNAINGINAMPAKGGRADLSDAEVTAAVEHMLAQ
jgi:cytochrome c5